VILQVSSCQKVSFGGLKRAPSGGEWWEQHGSSQEGWQRKTSLKFSGLWDQFFHPYKKPT